MHRINKQDRLILSRSVFQHLVVINKLLLFIRIEFMRHSLWLFVAETLAMKPFRHAPYTEKHLPTCLDIGHNLGRGMHQIGGQIFNQVSGLFGRKTAFRAPIFRRQLFLSDEVF
ncbi:hypothetical protein Xentx_01604 [Xenorhabdus thuongxuanensis]|uniref:Uncharacterized protein n=1 Tax=Xenorhabdus thuongxuanensis TaxID=1873484 RepID=A0A1Q5U4D3_9GAMM|nr:hypothetical protein Xentx_01604 [Xenorhabdus thuongxuanensis]